MYIIVSLGNQTACSHIPSKEVILVTEVFQAFVHSAWKDCPIKLQHRQAVNTSAQTHQVHYNITSKDINLPRR